jgi:AP-4 complex subunit mu-1
MIQEFLVISPRGDTLITKKVVGAGISQRATADIFLQHVKKEKSNSTAQPIFLLDGLTFCYQQHNHLYFVFTSAENVQAATLIELLQRLSRVFKVGHDQDLATQALASHSPFCCCWRFSW